MNWILVVPRHSEPTKVERRHKRRRSSYQYCWTLYFPLFACTISFVLSLHHKSQDVKRKIKQKSKMAPLIIRINKRTSFAFKKSKGRPTYFLYQKYFYSNVIIVATKKLLQHVAVILQLLQRIKIIHFSF